MYKLAFLPIAFVFFTNAIKWANDYLQQNGIETGLVWGILIFFIPILALIMKLGD